MIPILYEGSETSFSNNGLGRLYDCTSCIVSEERNGIYECDFEMPVDGAHFNDVKLGRIIAVKHDYSDDIQPFDIVSYSKPIDGKVTFHAVHVSYRLSQIVTWGTSINSLANAFSNFTNTAVPSNNFTFSTDKTSTGLVSAFDGVPKSIKSILGGTEGSILDAYGGEYKWDRFNVALYESRGLQRNLVVRYGINMTDYTDETDISEVYTHCVAFWKGQDGDNEVIVKTSLVNSGLVGLDDRTRAEALDLSDKFETKPTTSQLQTEAIRYMSNNQTNLPKQTISVSFINLRDTSEYAEFSSLFECGLCDTIKVVFPKYGMMGTYKIVKTVYDVLLERYDEMELGSLSTTLSEALGISSGSSGAGGSGSNGASMIVDYTEKDNNSINASTYGSVSLDVSKTGYDAIGIVGYRIENASSSGSNSSYALVYGCSIESSNTAVFRIRNTRNQAAKIKVTVFVLYRKESQ